MTTETKTARGTMPVITAKRIENNIHIFDLGQVKQMIFPIFGLENKPYIFLTESNLKELQPNSVTYINTIYAVESTGVDVCIEMNVDGKTKYNFFTTKQKDHIRFSVSDEHKVQQIFPIKGTKGTALGEIHANGFQLCDLNSDPGFILVVDRVLSFFGLVLKTDLERRIAEQTETVIDTYAVDDEDHQQFFGSPEEGLDTPEQVEFYIDQEIAIKKKLESLEVETKALKDRLGDVQRKIQNIETEDYNELIQTVNSLDGFDSLNANTSLAMHRLMKQFVKDVNQTLIQQSHVEALINKL